MTSSLASQLAGIKSLNAARLASTTSLHAHASYLFPPQTAARQDLDTVYALGESGWSELASQDANLAKWPGGQMLFGPEAKSRDRILLSKDENAELDICVERFFDRVGPVLLGKSSAKCLEWLIRRFRIQEFTPTVVLRAFLPYHHTPQFARILKILDIGSQAHLKFLVPLQKLAQPLPAVLLLDNLLAPPTASHSMDLLRLVAGVLPAGKRPHRAQLAFWSSTLVQFCLRLCQDLGGKNGKGKGREQVRRDQQQLVLGVLLPAITSVVADKGSGKEAQLAACLVLSCVGASFSLTGEAVVASFNAILPAILDAKVDRSLVQAVLTATAALFSAAGAQTPMPTMDLATARRVLEVRGIITQLQDLSKEFDMHAFTNALLSILIKDTDTPRSAAAITSLLSKHLGEGGIRASAAADCLLQLLRCSTHSSSAAIQIVADVRKVRPEVFDTLLQLLDDSSGGEGEGQAEAAKLLQDVLQIKTGTDSSDAGMEAASPWLSVNAAEPGQRAIALQGLFDSVKEHRIEESDVFVHQTLSSRLLDDDARVLQVLFDNAALVLKLLPPDAILSQSEAVLSVTSKLSQKSARAHLDFLLGPFLGANPAHADRLFRNILWHRLLITRDTVKSSQTTHEAIRDAAKTHDSTQNLEIRRFFAVLSGVTSPAFAARQTSVTPADRNQFLVDSIASEWMKSGDNEGHITFLQSQCGDTVAFRSAAFAFAVASALQRLPNSGLSNMLAARVVSNANDLLPARLPSVPSSGAYSATLWSQVFEEAPDVRACLKAQLLIEIAATQQMSSACLAAPLASSAAQVPLKDSSVAILEKLYLLATQDASMDNASICHALATSVIKSAGKDALKLLATIWTSSDVSTHARIAALTHCQAYLTARLRSKHAADFQVLLPALLLACVADSRDIRLHSIECIKSVQQLAKMALEESQQATIWGYDEAYGPPSSKLKYIDTEATYRLTFDIVQASESVGNDAQYLPALIGSLLFIEKGQDKRTVTYKRGLIAFLSAHVVAWPSYAAKARLLGILSRVRDSIRLPCMLPLIDEMIKQGSELLLTQRMTVELDTMSQDTLIQRVFDTYDRRAKTTLENDDTSAWALLLKGVGNHEPLVAKWAALALRSVFPVISAARRKSAIQLLATTVVSPDVRAPAEVRETLFAVEFDAPVLVMIFTELRTQIMDESLGTVVAKRVRTDTSKKDQVARTASLLSEILEASLSKQLPASSILLVELFEVLACLADLHTSRTINGDYLLHLSLALLHKILASATPTADVVASLRVDTVVNAIKASNNPATFQQALLLLSSIASLAPSTVLHSAMPVFTFVGSSVLQRDDAFSFTVVERVLQSIVPPLIKSIKEQVRAQTSSSLESEQHFFLLKMSRQYLCIFTDSAHHIPKHRRQTFFDSLVQTLGASQYAAAIAMLLVDRDAHKIIRHSDINGATHNALQLPLAVLHAQTGLVQLKACVDVWAEVERLWLHRDADPTATEQHVFLDRLARMSREHSDGQVDVRQQILALLAFLRHTVASPAFSSKLGRANQKAEVGELYEAYVKAALKFCENPDAPIRAVAEACLASIMQLVPVQAFMAITTTLADDAKAAMRSNGYRLLAHRLPSFDSTERAIAAEHSGALIVAASRDIGSSIVAVASKNDALALLKAVARTATPKEHTALSTMVPILVDFAASSQVGMEQRKTAFTTLKSLAQTLGVRLLGNLRSVVELCTQAATNAPAPALQSVALDTLTQLYLAIPSFMESYTQQIIGLAVREELRLSDVTMREGVSKSSDHMFTSVIKATPSHKLLSTIVTVWDRSTTTQAQVATLEFLQRVLRQVDRASIASDYKAVFRFLLRVLDQRRENKGRRSPMDVCSVEDAAIRAFVRLVFKLNETTFRPLFLRIFDWAALDLAEDGLPVGDAGLVARRIVLYKVSNALNDQLKGLISHYYATLLDLTIELLGAYQEGEIQDVELWTAVVASVDKSARYDEGSFWNPSRLQKLAPVFIGQLLMRNRPLVDSLGGSEELSRLIQPAVANLARTVPDESSLKVLNGALLSPLRVDDAQVRVAALTNLSRMWSESSLSSVLLGLVPETLPYIAELNETDDTDVREANVAFIRSVEAVLGEPLDSYLQ